MTNLARYLAEMKGGELWVHAARRRPAADVGGRSRRRARARLRRRGQGPAAARPPDLRRARLDPAAGGVESLNVSVAAAVLLYEARRQRAMPDPTLYLFDGYNLLHAGRSPTGAS